MGMLHLKKKKARNAFIFCPLNSHYAKTDSLTADKYVIGGYQYHVYHLLPVTGTDES